MRFGFARATSVALFALSLLTPSITLADNLIPTKRLVLSENTDFPGGDIGSIFDTTLDACQRACLTNKLCKAFTFNTRNGSCFPKSTLGEATQFIGAYSGYVLNQDVGVEKRAVSRQSELGFIGEWEFPTATSQAADLANTHTTNGYSAESHLQAAASSEANRDYYWARAYTGAALNLTDSAYDWAEYARLSLLAAATRSDDKRSLQESAFYAAINAYLRADDKALRHSILVTMGNALEEIGRGRDKVEALRLAQDLQPRDDTAKELDAAIGKYGFRITENIVQSNTARPKICVSFSEDLVKSGVDYASYVQLADPGLTVTSDGYRQLCVEGVTFGSRNTVTFRQGLPAANGQSLAKSVDITAYVRDRNPGVSFPGRGYVLPRTGEASLPVETVNTGKIDLTLYRVSDRNLMRSLQSRYFGDPMPDYQEYDFTQLIGSEIWTGEGIVKQEVNVDVTTRLPLDPALKDQPAGIYALRASVPGVDPYEVPASWQWFVVSDLGLTSLSGTDGLHVFVRSLGTAEAKVGTEVQLVSTANEVLATAVTDAMGYAKFDAALALGTGANAPALIVATDGTSDLAFMSLADPEFDLSDRGVSGREAAPPVDVFLTTDRGAYRAGDTIYATALARDAAIEAIVSLPLTAILRRPDGVEYSRMQVADAGAGGHVFALPVAGSAPRGVWNLSVYADVDAPALRSQTVLVEDFLPERIDFALSLANTPIRLGDMPNLTVDAKYLFGAPGADLAVEGEVLLRAAKQLEAWPGYAFGRYDDPFSARLNSVSGTRTDAAGQAALTLELPKVDDPGRPLELRATVRVAEGSGRPVERQISRLLAPSSDLIGIKPMFDRVVKESSDARFQLIGINAETKATPMAVKWTVTRIQTQYQWYQNGGSWYWEPVTSREKVADGTAELGGAATEIAAPVTWGHYEIVVERTDGTPTASSTDFYAGWYAPADATESPDTLELSLDKPAYASGETAMLRVVPRAAGTALVTVLSNHLVFMQAVEVKEGENLIPLTVTDEWGTGVYVTASVLRPMDVAAGRNPARALGLTHASIKPGLRALTASIETAAEAAPRGGLDVAVKVEGLADGDVAYVTIAAVDQGILNLTGFQPPNAQDHYFGQRKLGVGIRDIYGRLIDGLNGAQGEVRSGGDAGAQARLQAPPPTEELVAYFTGPIKVIDGYARTSFDLPSFNGTVKVMAVAWSKKGVGQASADVLVRDPVVVTASLPRFMGPGDQSRVLLEVVHATGPSGRISLDVSSNGMTLGQVPSGFDLGDNAKVVYAIPVTARDVGIQTIEVALTTPDGKQLKKTLTIPVQINDPAILRVSRFDLKKGQEFTFDSAAFAGMMPGTAKATLAIGPIARLNAPGMLRALDAYPYGCTEQITAKAMPLLYFDEIARVMELKGADNIQTRIKQAVEEVLTNQSSNGSFGLWQPMQDGGDMWLDAFVTDFLSRAKTRGIAVPDQAFRSALDNLRNQVNYYADFDKGGNDLAYALMVLAREGAAAVGDLRYYADVKGDAFSTATAMAQLGAALASYGDQPRADAMFRRAANALDQMSKQEKDQIFRLDYGTDYRDTAAVLALAVEAGSTVVDREALTNRIATTRSLSTQEATWALLAANALIDRTGNTDVLIDGAEADGPLVRAINTATAKPVSVLNTGADTAITVSTYGVPTEPEPAGGTGYAIERLYYTMQGEPMTLERIKVGTRFVTVLEVSPFGRGEARLMVSDPLPAGIEIDSPNLISSSSDALADLGLESEVAHSEFRQDRFLTAIDRYDNATFRLAYVARAVSPGVFHHPAASVEDMYRPDLTGRTAAGSITIAE